MKKKPQSSHLILFLIVVLMSFMGCDNPFDKSPSSQPDFTAAAAGRNGDVFIQITAERDSRNVDGGGMLIIGDDINGERFDIEVIDATLSTDFGAEDPIPQTDNLLVGVDFVCTPAFAEFDVRVSGDFGEAETKLRLNECEKDNPDIFEEDGMIINPCTEEEVTDIEQFRGICIAEEFGGRPEQDTIVLEEFDGFCGSDAPCVVPIDVVINVPAFQ